MIDLGLALVAEQGPCFLSIDDLFKHTYIVGKTGTGKSTFMLNLALEVIHEGWACIFIEPKGSVIAALNSLTDKDRVVKVSIDHPVTINPLRKKGRHINDLISEFGEVLDILVKQTSSNPELTVMMKEIVTQAILCFDEKQRNLDYLYEFLRSPHIREKHFENRDRPQYWKDVALDPRTRKPNMAMFQESATRLATRLAGMVSDPRIKKIVCGENELDIGQIAEQKKVLLADTSMMTFDNRVYITSLIAHYVKSYVEFERRKHPLIVFIDEFQTAISPVFSHLLALARGYKVGFVLAHQEFGQIDKTVLKSVLGNANTIVCFTVGYDEADRMRHEYASGVKADDFIQLGDYEALIKIKNKVHRVMTFPPPDMPEPAEEELPPERKAWNFMREGWFQC